MGLPISVNWTFFARSYGWGATRDYRFKIGESAILLQRGQVEGVAPNNHSFPQKTGVNSFVRYTNLDWYFFRFVTIQFTRLTNWQTEFSSLDRVCIPCSAVKTGARPTAKNPQWSLGHTVRDSRHARFLTTCNWCTFTSELIVDFRERIMCDNWTSHLTYLAFSVYFGFSELTHKICQYGSVQNTGLTHDKELNILIYGTPSNVVVILYQL